MALNIRVNSMVNYLCIRNADDRCFRNATRSGKLLDFVSGSVSGDVVSRLLSESVSLKTKDVNSRWSDETRPIVWERQNE